MNARRGTTVLSLASALFFGGLLAPGVASASGGDDPSWEECKEWYWDLKDNGGDWEEWWDKCGDRFDPKDFDHHDKDKNGHDEDKNGHDKDKDKNGHDKDKDKNGHDKDKNGHDKDKNGHDKDKDRNAHDKDNKNHDNKDKEKSSSH